MANRSHQQEQPDRPSLAYQSGIPFAYTEPEVRRWPHPVTQAEPPQPAAGPQAEPALHYIHCALSYQNQLLADIKALLEQLTVDSAPRPEEK